MNQTNLYPDPTRGKKYFYWKSTYDFTVNFLNKNTELKIGCEVGVAGGQNIKHILEYCPHITRMFGVDSYSKNSWDMEHIDIEKEFNGFDGLFNEVNSMLSQFGERVKLIRKFSSEASKEFDDNSLFFVFIDAGHEFIDCYNDILHWYPKVKENGLIMGHDWYHPQFKAVTKSVMKVFKTENIQYFKQPNHIWFVRKNSNNLSTFEKLKKKFLFYLNHPKLFFRVF